MTAVEFARDAALPEFAPTIMVENEGAAPAPNFEKPALAITVGSQIASFAEDVEPALRKKIANAFLFAQQAADKQIEGRSGATSTDWYGTYTDVLSRIGWLLEDRSATIRRISSASADVHQAIIPIVTAALAPAAVAPLIVQVLNGLREMDKNRPWITLFNRTSQRAQANQFQIAHVGREGTVSRIKLIAFELDARHAVSQVLFFKFATDDAKLLHFEAVLSVNEPIFNDVAPIIEERLQDRIRNFILAIDI